MEAKNETGCARKKRHFLTGIAENVVPSCFSDNLQRQLKKVSALGEKELDAALQEIATVDQEKIEEMSCVSFIFVQPSDGQLVTIKKNDFLQQFFFFLQSFVLEKLMRDVLKDLQPPHGAKS